MTAHRITTLALCAAMTGLGACSTLRSSDVRIPPPPPPPSSMESRVSGTPVAPALPKGCVDQKCARRALAMHRQYFDQRHKRYYYYDPSRRAYFWEDGAPKS